MRNRVTTPTLIVSFCSFFVPVILCHYNAIAHDDDWVPVSKDHGASLISMTPSFALPSNMPSAIPNTASSESSTRLQEFQVYGLIEFDEFRDSELDTTSQKIFQRVCSEFITMSLNAQGGGNFNANLTIDSYQIAALPPAGNIWKDRKNKLRKQTYVEEGRQGIEIFMDIHVTVRSDSIYSLDILIQRINSTLADLDSKEKLILQLQQLDNDVFYPINSMTTYLISDKIIVFGVNDDKSLDILLFIMITVVFAITLIAATWHLVSRHQRSKLRPVLKTVPRGLSTCLRYSPELLDGFFNHPDDYDIRMSTSKYHCWQSPQFDGDDCSTRTPPSVLNMSNRDRSLFRSSLNEKIAKDFDGSISDISIEFPINLEATFQRVSDDHVKEITHDHFLI